MLVPAICPNCGAILKIDDTKEAAVCTYCQTPFISEKSIQNYNIRNTINIQNATIIKQEESEEIILQRGITQIKIGQYDEAKKNLLELSKKHPDNWKCWYGLALIQAYASPDFDFRLEDGKRRIIPDEVLVRLSNENAPTEGKQIAIRNQKISHIRSQKFSDNESIDQMAKTIADNTTNTRIFGFSLIGLGVAGLIFLIVFMFGDDIFIMFSGLFFMGFCFLLFLEGPKIKSNIQENRVLRNSIEMLEKKRDPDSDMIHKLQDEVDELQRSLKDKLNKNGVNSVEEYYYLILEKY